MENFNPGQLIPANLRVDSVDDILYKIGLCFTSVRDRPKRKRIYHPMIVFTFVSMYLTKEMTIICLNNEEVLLMKQLGSYGHLLGIRWLLGVVIMLFSILSLISQLIYYNNYRNGINPTFLRVFQMMSGLVSPKSLGLTDQREIRKLLKTTRIGFKYLEWNNNNVIPIMGFLTVFPIYLSYTTPLEVTIYGIPNSIITSFWAVYVFKIFVNQFFCFSIICLYLKLKINRLNESLFEIKDLLESEKRFSHSILCILKSMNTTKPFGQSFYFHFG